MVFDTTEETNKADFMKILTDRDLKLRVLPEQKVDGEWIVSYFPNKKTTVFFRTIPPECKETLIFMMPNTYYDKLLVSAEDTTRNDFLYYEGELLLSRGGADIIEEQICSIVEAVGADAMEEMVQEVVSIDGSTYLLILLEGKSGIVYGTLNSMEVFHSKFMSEQWGIILLVLVCLIPACLVLGVGSRKVMHKVKNLNALLNNEEVNYDLNSIENGIQTLVMTHKESEKENLPLRKTRFIRNLIRGGYADKSEALAEAYKAELNIDYKLFLVVLIRNREINNENKAYAFMLDTIEKEEKVEGYGVHLINNNQNLFVLFANEQEDIENVLEKMMEIERAYCQDYVVAIGNYHSDYRESSKAYLEAETAFDNHLLTDNSKIIRFAEVVKKEYRNLLPDNYLQRLRYAIRAGDETAVEIAVKDICNKMNGENASLYTFRILYNDIIHVLLSEWTGDKTEFENFYSVFSLTQCLNIQDFNDLLCDVCKTIIDNRAGKEIKNSKIVEQAIAYMQMHFAEPDLTMNALAEYLKVSPVTLAVEFKNEMDVRPSDYLANLRMEKAKELLANTSLLIREVSQMVGYEDDHVFMRRFKKYTGQTPGQYRKEE